MLVTAPSAPEAELAARAGRIVDAALAAGANNVGSIDFFLADPSEAEDQALTLAVHNAESDAQTIALAAGVTLAGPSDTLRPARPIMLASCIGRRGALPCPDPRGMPV